MLRNCTPRPVDGCSGTKNSGIFCFGHVVGEIDGHTFIKKAGFDPKLKSVEVFSGLRLSFPGLSKRGALSPRNAELWNVKSLENGSGNLPVLAVRGAEFCFVPDRSKSRSPERLIRNRVGDANARVGLNAYVFAEGAIAVKTNPGIEGKPYQGSQLAL